METDFTICDFAADLRAPTLCGGGAGGAGYAGISGVLPASLPEAEAGCVFQDFSGKARVDWSVNRPAMRSPLHFIEQKRILLDTVSNRLNQGFLLRVSKAENRLSVISGKLDALSPFRVLGTGVFPGIKAGKLN